MIHIAFRVQHTTRWTPNSTGRNLIFFIKMASLGCTPMSDKANSVKSLICPFSANLFSYYFLIFHDILYICYSLYIYIYILPEQFPVYSLYISHTFPTYSPIHSLYIYVCISTYIYVNMYIQAPYIYIYMYIYTFPIYIHSIHSFYTYPLYIPYITWETPCLDLILPAPRHGLHRGRESWAGFCGAKEQRRLGISGGQTPKDG